MEQLKKVLGVRYKRLYGARDCTAEVDKATKDIVRSFLIVLISFIAIILFSILGNASPTDSVMVNEKGYIASIKRPDQGNQPLRFNVIVKTHSKEGIIEKEIPVFIDPVGGKQSHENYAVPEESDTEKIDIQLRKSISSINEDTTKTVVVLPSKLESVETLAWIPTQSSNTPLYFIGLTVALTGIYRRRFYSIEREERNAKESIVRELPEFINKIVLLLNAGIVLNSAFMKIMEDRIALNQDEAYFYGQMITLYVRIKETNGSMHKELKEFSKRSGVRELMRVSNIISDNVDKGTDLAEKLQRENEFLWFSRKQQSEEKGRLAESKLTMPLVILLLVLVMVTIAPALIGM